MADLARSRTILLSTHIVADLGSGCADLALIDGGSIVFRGSPGEIVAHARGKVFELDVAATAEPSLGPGVELVARTSFGSGVRLRAVSAEGRLPEGARAVDAPTLEEGYMAFMAARGRAEAARAEEAPG
jgi:ABC-2 type transport system ATP-binding protein